MTTPGTEDTQKAAAPSSPRGPYLLPSGPEELPPLLEELDEMVIPQMFMSAGDAGQDGWQLPEEFTDPRMPEAWSRIYHGITEALEPAEERGLIAPDGVPYMSLALVTLDDADVQLLRAADARMQQAVVGAGDDTELEHLAELLDQVADYFADELRGPRGEKRDGSYLAGLLHMLLAVLDLSGLEQAQQLSPLIATESDLIRLDETQADTYRQLAFRYAAALGKTRLELYRYYAFA